MGATTSIERCGVRVTGTVQGVGMRPFVYRTAVALGLTGTVRNDRAGILIDVQGAAAGIVELCRRVVEDGPPLARIESVATTPLQPTARGQGFRIVESDADGSPGVAVAVDTATCAECLAEIGDPADRRYHYPFTNCTNCGPRYTIMLGVPYDRVATTMNGFRMCDRCRTEYEDPGDRRFHAEPICCPTCGPRLRFLSPTVHGPTERDLALEAAARMLDRGGIVALKGVGGFHLAVDATNVAAVAELRRRKARDDKPFAVMVPDVETARALCELDDTGVAALTSYRSPIVVAPRRGDAKVVRSVAPDLPELGVLLPYSPLHHLLAQRLDRPLVMTSGNLGDEPIAYEDADACHRLAPLVDGVLTHDRPIHVRCDDSVVRVSRGRLQVLRRSRGYAPEELRLPGPTGRAVLAVGAELKNTVAVATGASIGTSHHVGDLEHLAAYRSFTQAIERLCELLGVAPEIVAHDLHPEYLSTKWALDSGLPTLAVQHHHAHVASCLVEHGRTDPVLGLAFDGLGYGSDATLWGGEFLVADLAGYERVAHLRPAPLPGGTAALRQPWRMALSWAHLACGIDVARAEGRRYGDRAPAVLELATDGRNLVTTSVGRLFDAVAALLGIRTASTYEGQAAIELEALARTVARAEAPVYEATVDWAREGGGSADRPRAESAALPPGSAGGRACEADPENRSPSLRGRPRDAELPVLDPAPLIRRVLQERDRATPPAMVAAGFHEGLGRAAAGLATELATARGLDTVALSGGVFQNVRLTEIVEAALGDAGLAVLVHRDVPPNDGGISIGQAAIAAAAPQSIAGG